jgi:hypothetical protein
VANSNNSTAARYIKLEEEIFEAIQYDFCETIDDARQIAKIAVQIMRNCEAKDE